MNIKARALRKGDRVGVVSPASTPPDEERYQRGIQYLQQLGYEVITGKSVLNRRGYLAGNDDERINDLNEMFADPGIKAIFCSRGGYGAPRILDRLDFDVIKKNPKIFIGYSDITVLNLAIWAKTNLITFSGPMVAVEMGKGINKFSEISLWDNLTVTRDFKKLVNPDDVNLKVIKPGVAKGHLIPACLSVFNGFIGTPYMPELEGSILILEDIDEEPYRIDRYFSQLKLAGVFQKIKGLVLGQFIDCVAKDATKPTLTVEEVIDDYTKDLNIPIMANFAYGHGEIKNTVPIGVQAKLDTTRDYIEILENTVEGNNNV